jgi:hypothetical protein
MGGFPYAGRIVASRDDAPFRVLLGPTSFTPASVVVSAGDDIGRACSCVQRLSQCYAYRLAYILIW